MLSELTLDEKWELAKQRLRSHDEAADKVVWLHEMLIEAFGEIRRLQDVVEAHDYVIRSAQRENRI